MNTIHKTIISNATGLIIVVSENASGKSKSKKNNSPYSPNNSIKSTHHQKESNGPNRKISLIAPLSLALTVLFSGQTFATINYSGAPGQLTSSGNIGGNFSQLIGSPILNGVIDLAPPPTAQPLDSGADTTINYASGTTPGFVVSGYATANPNGTTETATASNNKSQLVQGVVTGNTYTGLSHITLINPEINCNIPASNCTEASSQTTISEKRLTANNNSTIISGVQATGILGDISSGYSLIYVIDDNLISKTPSTSQAQASEIDTFSSNTLENNFNSITLSKSNQQFSNTTAGYSGIRITYGEVRGGDSTITSGARSSAISQTTGNSNTLTANNNTLSFTANGNIFNKITSGQTEIIVDREDVFAANAVATSPSFQYASATANATDNSISTGNTLTSENNIITSTGNDNSFNDIVAGNNHFHVRHGNVNAGTANSFATASTNASDQERIDRSTLISRKNKITLTGNNNTYNNITTGYSLLHSEHQNVTAGTATSTSSTGSAKSESFTNANNSSISTNENTIEINGTNNKINNLISGHSGFKTSTGTVTGGTTNSAGSIAYGDSSLSINTNNIVLSSNNNSINVVGTSTITGNIHTGYIDFNIAHGAVKKADGSDGTISFLRSSTRAFATNNTISITGEHTINNTNTSIYGGYLAYNPTYNPLSYDAFTGNTLNYNNALPISIGELANFQTYNFTINPEFANSPTSLITANHISLDSNLTNTSSDRPNVNSDIYVKYISAGKIIPNNSEFILMQSNNLEGNGVGHRTDSLAQQGISLLYDVSTFIRANQVIAVVEGGPTVNPNPPPTDPGTNPPPTDPNQPTRPTDPEITPPPQGPGVNPPPQGPEANPQLKALLSGNLSGLMLVTRGADNIADNLLGVISEQNMQRGLVPFIMFSANHSRYDTGSYIKSDGGLITAGISFQDEQLTTGAFIEQGWDSYTTFNKFEIFKDTHGKGHNRLNGFGLYSHYNFNDGLYADASLRSGRLHTNFSSDDIRHPENDIKAKYSTRGNYYSLHLTTGGNLKITASNNLDISLKYLWSKTEGHDIEIVNEPIRLNKISSQRLRVNGENTYAINQDLGFITGLAYEYEYEAKAQGAAFRNYPIQEPSVKGGTGIATAGLRYQPTEIPNFTLDLKASGYFGKRDGGSGLLHMSYAF